MTSVILPPSIQTRLKIQRKFIHQKDNRNQEGVYSKHTWKHFLPVRKSPLVFFLLPSSSLENFSLCPHNPNNPSVFLPLSRIYINLPPKNPPNLLEENPFFLFPFYAMHAFLFTTDSLMEIICVILLKKQNLLFFKSLLVLFPNRWRPISS